MELKHIRLVKKQLADFEAGVFDVQKFIVVYNTMCKYHARKEHKLDDLTNDELVIFVTGGTLNFGRSLIDSYENAVAHMEHGGSAETGRKNIISRFGSRHPNEEDGGMLKAVVSMYS